MKTISLTLALSLASLLPSAAAAQVQVEVDPIAYALHGYSLHVARVMGHLQLDAGVFGADIPQKFHGNDGWSASARGVGLKLDYSPELGVRGLFAGMTTDYGKNRYTLDATSASETRRSFGVGVRGGYRMPVGDGGLYVAPWLGLGYATTGRDVVIDSDKFRQSHLQIFPTVHAGWRF